MRGNGELKTQLFMSGRWYRSYRGKGFQIKIIELKNLAYFSALIVG